MERLRQPEPTGPLDRAERIAALVTANARLGDPPGRCENHVPKKIVEALLDRAK